jgi:hypothetical protein
MNIPDEIITIKVFIDPVQATEAQDKLREAGIDAFFDDQNAKGIKPVGGTELRVFISDKEKAKSILSL